jgi:hypothetical protein
MPRGFRLKAIGESSKSVWILRGSFHWDRGHLARPPSARQPRANLVRTYVDGTLADCPTFAQDTLLNRSLAVALL